MSGISQALSPLNHKDHCSLNVTMSKTTSVYNCMSSAAVSLTTLHNLTSPGHRRTSHCNSDSSKAPHNLL